MNREKSYARKIRLDKAQLWGDRKPILGRLDIELTERCNNNCIHCYINLPENDLSSQRKELSTQEIKDVVQEAASLGCITVRFTGGEPLLREDFEDLYVFTRNLGIKVIIFTNATKITPNLAELLARIPPLKMIEVSIYGIKKKSYEAVTRVPGSFEAAWRGIHLLLEKRVPFVVKSAFLPPIKKEMAELEKWADTIPWMDQLPSYSLFFDLHARQNRIKNKLIQSLRVSPEAGLDILNRDAEGYLREMKEFCSRFAAMPGEKVFSCGAGTRSGCLDAYGNFQLCLLLRHPDTLYNLKKGTLKDALINFFPNIRETKAKNPEYLERCTRCFLKGLCLQCPARSWAECGTLDTPVEYFCQIAHIQAKNLGVIGEGEKSWEIKDWEKRIEKFSQIESLAGECTRPTKEEEMA